LDEHKWQVASYRIALQYSGQPIIALAKLAGPLPKVVRKV